MALRGIRGAVTANRDDCKEVLESTQNLLDAILKANPDLKLDDIASALFTVTPDITSVFPAKAARDMGWQQVPLMNFQEIPVIGSLRFCIRVLIHWNTDHSQEEIRHIYLGKAQALRPDIISQGDDLSINAIGVE